MSAVQFVLDNTAGVCKAFLQIIDSINPLNSLAFNRIVNGPDFIFRETSSSNDSSFEIIDGYLNVTSNTTFTDVTIYYIFNYNNFNTSKYQRIHLGKNCLL